MRTHDAVSGVLTLLAMFALWRLSLVGLSYIGLNFLPDAGKCRRQWQVFSQEHYLLNGYFRWDAAWYRSIVAHGYEFRPGHGSNAAFYPAMPYLTRLVGWLVGDWRWGGLFLVNACTFVASWALSRISKNELPEIDDRLSAQLMLVFPTSFFLVSFFSESVYLCFSVLSFLSYRRTAYGWAGFWGMAAMLSRSTGVVLFCAYAVDLAWQWWKSRQAPPKTVLWLLLVPAGLGTFALILWIQTNEPLAFLHAQSHWRPRPSWPLRPLYSAFVRADWSLARDPENARRILEALIALLTLVSAAIMAWLRWRPVFWVYTAGVALMALSTGTMMGMSRMCLVAFPMYLLWASVLHGRSTWKTNWLCLSSGLLVLTMIRFMSCGWVA